MLNINSIKAFLAIKVFAKGAVIINEKEPDYEQFYILMKGQVNIVKGWQTTDEHVIAELREGDFFGEIPFFLKSPWPVTVVAMESTLAAVVNNENIFDFFRNRPETAISIIRTICSRARDDFYGDIYSKTATETEHKVLEHKVLEHKALEHKTFEHKKPEHKKTEHKAVPQNTLFPQGHGAYSIIVNEDGYRDLLYNNKLTCPLCSRSFATKSVRMSQVLTDRIDQDLRVHYKRIEPMYYEVVTCPHCWYSAMADMFNKGAAMNPQKVIEELLAFKAEIGFDIADNLDDTSKSKIGFEIAEGLDALSIFARYYLALFCAPRCFLLNPQNIISGLWLKLSRLYHDQDDEKMENYAIGQALESYIYLYQNLNLQPKPMQRVCYLIGELYYKQDNIEEAKKFFFKAKTNRHGVEQIRRNAEERLDKIKKLEKAALE